MVVNNMRTAKFTIWTASVIILMVWLVQSAISQLPEISHQQFQPPLKGTEILMEADQITSPKRRRGIWALDPKTGTVCFLIPNGSNPIWSPNRNYFAYRDGDFIRVVNRSGTYDVSMPSPLRGGELMGWGHAEKWVLFMTPILFQVYPERQPWMMGEEGCQYFQIIHFALFDPEEHSLLVTGDLSIALKVFPFHHCGNLSVSPDGKYIAFEIFKYASGIGKFRSKIVVAELDRNYTVKMIRRLTELPEHLMEINPKWSLDGKQIAFDIVDLQKSSRTTHIINVDGTGLKGLNLTREEITVTTRRGSRFREIATFIRIEEGLVTEEHENELRALGWLQDNRLVVAESKYSMTRFADVMDDPIADCGGVWIVDFKLRHPPTLITPGAGGDIRDAFLLLSPDRRQLAWSMGVGDSIISMQLFSLPDPEDKEAILIRDQWYALLRWSPQSPRSIVMPDDLAVYRMNW